jgi:pimeloyl-ACP methyl ester carboxylesterase
VLDLKIFKFLALFFLVTLLSACGVLQYRPFQPMNQPIMRVDVRSSSTQQAPVLLVLLPGAYDTPNDFIDQGFVKTALELQLSAAISFDIALLDAHIGFYTNQQIVTRLRDEVVLPAKALGYSQVWLAGISLGGYGSLLYSMREGQGVGSVDGIFIMAPFMGSRHLPAEVAKAGGLVAWKPATLLATSADNQHTTDIDDELWAWLKHYANTDVAARKPVIYLGFGEDDRFVASNRLLGAVLPSKQVMTVAGGHTWGPWLALWRLFLEQKPWVANENTATK